VVLVGINHRINVFGYTYLGGLNKKYEVGNPGQLDLVAALEWVRDNIANFGGDPQNVMIFGESGGGGKISALMAMPGAKGLFHKAAVQSGSTLRVGDVKQATARTKALLAKLGLNENQLDELQKVPAEKLYAASLGGGQDGALVGGPVIDGHSITHQTWDPQAPAESANIPLLVGNDKDESTLFSMGDESLFHLNETDHRARLVKARIPEDAVDPLLALYHRDHANDSPTDIYFRISSDRGARRNAARQAELKVEQGKANVYVYYCQYNTPLADGKLKSFHTSDLPLTMRLVRFPESEQLSK
jgi:para-nitrobenzyl esterase